MMHEKSRELKHALTEVLLQYNQTVDEAKGKNPDKLFHQKTGYSLRAKVEEAFDQTGFYQDAPKKLDKNQSYESTVYSLQAYERFKKGEHDRGTLVYEKDDLTDTQKAASTAGYAAYRANVVLSKIKQNIQKNQHTRYLQKTEDLKSGDIIQIYQPYEDDHLKEYAKNEVDRYGQNRYYAIMQPLPNGDFLAVDFRGHRQTDESDICLEYNPKYSYPTSPHVQPTLNTYGHLLVQLPKEAILKGSAMREKYEAASFGKVYDEMQPRSIRVLEMSPSNQKKLQDFRQRFNKERLDLGWSRTHNIVVGNSLVGKGAVNPYFIENTKHNLQSGVYEARNALLTRTLAEQAKIREKLYGPESTHRIQSDEQKEFMAQERKRNHQKYHSSQTKEDTTARTTNHERSR